MALPPPKDGKSGGAGLGHLFPSEEPRTAKMPSPAAMLVPTILCPECNGELYVQGKGAKATTCPTCNEAGSVSQNVFDTYVAEHPDCPAAKQLAAKQGNTF